MSVRLADIIEVLEAAYPPQLAQDWDSVGLVCGDPADTVETVTVAVDATAAVVAEVPDRGLLLAHHPLLLRGVDTVAASTAKGALVHQMIRAGRALFTAHTNADAASPGVSDALADALGLAVEEVLAPISVGPGLDKWVVFVPAENSDAVREAMFAAGGGHIGDYSHCSWSVSGTGQFLPHEGAAPTIGSVGTVERVPEERVEVIAPTRLRGHVLAASGRLIRTRSLPSTSSRWRRSPAMWDWVASVPCQDRRPCRPSCLGCTMRCLARHGESGRRASRRRACRGLRCAAERGTRCWTPSRSPEFRPTSPRICGTIPPMSTGVRRMWRWSTSRTGPVSSRGVHRRRRCCVNISVSRYPCGYRLCAPIRGMSREKGHES